MSFMDLLERRRLLTCVYSAGTLNLLVQGTSGDDVVSMNISGGHSLSVVVNGVVEFTLPSAHLSSNLLTIVVQTFGGNDKITLGSTILKTCTISGGDGNDSILSGDGPDTIFGGDGNDSMDGGMGADLISGGNGNDTVSYASHKLGVNVTLDNVANDGGVEDGAQALADTVGANSDIECIIGGSGNDVLTGNNLGNYICGGAGADLIHGGAGSDTIVGGAGMDSLYGDDDADFIFARDGEFDVIDGGPGIDSADTDPFEGSPLPAVLAAAAPVKITAVGVTRSSRRKVFSIKRVTSRKTSPKSPPIISRDKPLPASPLPGSDVEGPVDPATLQSILQPLEPYCAGQVLVTRDSSGIVVVTGTSSDDTFVVRTPGSAAGFLEILNKEGLTQFELPTPMIHIMGNGGNDSLTVAGNPGSVAAFNPDSIDPNAGSFTADGHTITYGGAGEHFTQLAAADFDSFTYVTPRAQDSLTVIGGQTDADPVVITGQSDGQPLPIFPIYNCQAAFLDTGTNDVIGNADDQIAINSSAVGATIRLGLFPGIGNDTLALTSGSVSIANNPRKSGVPASLTVTQSGGTLSFNAPLTELASLLMTGGRATLGGGPASVLSVGALQAPGGQLDVMKASLIVDYVGANPIAVIAGSIKSGFNSGGWNGPGIMSSEAAASSGKALGYADSAQLFGVGGGMFMGVPVDDSATLVSFTLSSDANLDRQVNFGDLVALAQNYNGLGGDWLHGDFNYDGVVNFSDLVALAQGYNTTLI